MGIFDKLFGKKQVEVQAPPEPAKEEKPKKPRKPRQSKVNQHEQLSPKEIATQKGEPYVHIVRMEIDPNDVNNGAFELDWNEKFVANLVRAGYSIKPGESENVIVDRWFQTVCRNVVLEVYEQQQADPEKRDDVRVIRTRDLGNGRTEVS